MWGNRTRKKMTQKWNQKTWWKQKLMVIREHAQGEKHQKSMKIKKYRGKKELRNRREKGLDQSSAGKDGKCYRAEHHAVQE